MSLVLRDIRHSYGSGLVVDGASLEAGPGEIVALFGPSGCGKTTLLRIAAGLEPLQGGAVELGGETLANAHMKLPAEKRAVGFVLQDYVLFPHMTVAENIAFGLAGLAAAERDARIAAELKLVDLEAFAGRYPHELSGGQQQRAALARSFARRPRAMLLDEPFASIDVALRQRLRADLRRLLKHRATPAIFVTHDPAEAVEIGDVIAVMQRGRIVETGTPERLYQSPKTVAAATLFPGSQALQCRATKDGVETAFGPMPGLVRPDDAAFLVIHDGGAVAKEDYRGAAEIIDCRFAGPGWIATLAAGGATLRAAASEPLKVGEKASVSLDHTRLRIVAS